MARIKLAYLGGGSTRGAGTMASFMHHGADFDGSEVVLIDLDADRLELVRALAEKMAAARGLDITVSATTDRRAGLADCDAVLSSFRPGGFAARVLDEKIPLLHGAIGQETQGAGGFFMALRAINVLKGVCEDLAEVAPRARIYNYTNPVNIVAQAITANTDVPIVSLCEGPIYFQHLIADAAQLDNERIRSVMVGLNHGSWSVEHTYDGEDLIPHVVAAWERRRDDPTLDVRDRRLLRLAATMGAIPAEYFKYYYFEEEILAYYRARSRSRAEIILESVPDYWTHYREQLGSSDPQLDPDRSRGGIHELELAIDVMDSVVNDKGEIHPVNVPNTGGLLPGLPHDCVVEITGRCDRDFVTGLPQRPLPRHLMGLVEALAEYQMLAAQAAWSGTRRDGIQALVANPLVRSLARAEAIYDELARAHAAHLPARLLA